jgi:hypothetical protein
MPKSKSGNPTKPAGKPSAFVDTRVIYCGDNLEQLKKLPDACVDLVYIDSLFNSNRNYEAFWGETKEMRAFEDRHESTQAYIEFMRPRCVELARVLKETGSSYRQRQSDWHCLNGRGMCANFNNHFSGRETPPMLEATLQLCEISSSPGTPVIRERPVGQSCWPASFCDAGGHPGLSRGHDSTRRLERK